MRALGILILTAALAVLTACAGDPPPLAVPSPPAVAGAVTAVPQSCLDALDKAEAALMHAKTGLGYMSEIAGISAKGWEAAARFDTAGIDEASTGIERMNGKLNDLAPKVGAVMDDDNAAAAKCRGAS